MNKTVFLMAMVIGSALLSGCASQKKDSELSVVDFSEGEAKEEITITNRINTDYGPSPEGSASSEDSEKAKPVVVALDLYPSLYNSLGFVSTFAELEKAGIKVNIISASGFSSILAALYAKYEASNMVEWKAFELYQLLGTKKPFSDDWKRALKEFLEGEFKEARLSQLKMLLVIPKTLKGKIVFDTNQKVSAAIMDTVNLSGGTSLLSSANFNYAGKIKKYGADYMVRVSFLPERITLTHPDGFVFGIYSRLSGKLSTMKGSKNNFIFNQTLEGDIDSFKNLSDTIYQTKEDNVRLAGEAKDLIQNESGKN